MAPIQIQPLDTSDIQIPYYFRCPISLELMSDPVTVCTGQTYDRCSIECWIRTGNSTCPITRTLLNDFILIPNHTLRRLIQDWCVSNRCFGVERILTPNQPAEPALVRSLLNQAASGLNSVQSRIAVLQRVRGLARDSEKNRSVISDLNVRDVVVSILFNSNDNNLSSDELKYESLAILAVFPLSDPDCCTAIGSDPDRVKILVNLLFHPTSAEVRVNSAALIESVISGTKWPEHRSIILSSDEIFPGVITVLTCAQSYSRALKVGIKTLFALSLNKQQRGKAISAGAPHALITCLAELDTLDCERALATIELLCRVPEGCAAFGAHSLTVPLLVKLINKQSERASEYATGALLSLCSSSEQLQREVVNAGVLTQLLLLIQSDCTVRAKRKAQLLLKLVMDSLTDN